MEWNLDDKSRYALVHSFEFPEAFTYADMRKGRRDKDKREYIRSKAAKNFPINILEVQWWAFRIFVGKTGMRQFDIENVPKLIIDSFCKRQIIQDKSGFKKLALYDDDTLDYVKILAVGGSRSTKDFTKVEIFGAKKKLI